MRLTVIAAAIVSLVVTVISRPVTEMVDEEMRTRLSRLPNAVIFLISLKLPREIRRDLVDEWTSEMEAVVSGTEGLPVTRLLAGLGYAWDLYRFQRADARMLTGFRRRHASRDRVRRERVAILASLMVFVLIAGAGGAVVYHFYRTYVAPPDFSGSGTGSVAVQIDPGESATAVGDRLAALGVVASAQAFSNAVRDNPEPPGDRLKPGTYRVHKHMSAYRVLALLLNPASQTSSR